MKQASELNADDLEKTPIWKTIDPAKGLVEPWPKKGAAPLLSIVRTECTAADGSTYIGCAMLTKIALISPVVFAAGRRIELYHRNEPTASWKESAYVALGRTSDAFFPATVRMVVSSQHQPMLLKYDGFVFRSHDGEFVSVR